MYERYLIYFNDFGGVADWTAYNIFFSPTQHFCLMRSCMNRLLSRGCFSEITAIRSQIPFLFLSFFSVILKILNICEILELIIEI